SNEGWTFRSSWSESSGSLIRAPNAHTTTALGSTSAIRSPTPGSLTLSGCSSGISSARAVSATGGEVSLRPRPRARSGRVNTSAGRCACSWARRLRTAAANSDVPRKTVVNACDRGRRPLGGARRLLRLAHRAPRLLARLARDAVEDQNAAQMVYLVLDDTCRQPLRLDLELLPGLVLRTHPHLCRALHLDVNRGQAQASLFRDLELLAHPLEHRVHERRDRVLGVGA